MTRLLHGGGEGCCDHDHQSRQVKHPPVLGVGAGLDGEAHQKHQMRSVPYDPRPHRVLAVVQIIMLGLHGDCTAVARAAATMLTSPGRPHIHLCLVWVRGTVGRHATSSRGDRCQDPLPAVWVACD